MTDFVSAAFAVERLKVLAGEILKVAAALRERHPAEYEKRERLGILESVADDFLESEKEQEVADGCDG